MGIKPEDIFEVGLVVPDLEKAMAELHAAYGLTFTDILDGTLPMRDAEGVESEPRLRMAYARNFPTLEMIEEQPGTRLAKPEGTALHHLGAWTDDLARDSQELVDKGFPIVTAGRYDGKWPAGWTYHMTSFGTLIELVDAAARPAVERIIREGTFGESSVGDVRGTTPAPDAS